VLAVHGFELRLRVPSELLGARERGLVLGPPHVARLLDFTGAGRAAAEHHARLDAQPHIAWDLIEPDRRRVREPRIDVALPEIGRLKHVHVTVGDPQAVVRHRVLF